jgi:hypothetical protein
VTMHGDFSPEARADAERKARAAAIFAEYAEVIVAALPDVPDGHVLVAIVDDEHAFSGTHHVAQTEIVARVPELEGGGWAMVFTSGSDVDEVRRRTDEMGDLARRRAEMITRILTRRGSA